MRHPITTTALALLLAAGVSQAALAQGRGGDRDGGEQGQGGGRGQRGDQGQRGGDQQRGGQGWQGRGPDQAQVAPPQAREAPQAAPAPRQGQVSRATLAEDFRRQRDEARTRGDQPRPDAPRPQAPRTEPPRVEQAPRPGETFDRNRPDRQNRYQGDRNWTDRSRGGDEHRWDGRRTGDGARQQWERGRYPPIYRSPERFRIDRYRAPSGYYFRQWGFGDFLPRGWYGPQYELLDFFAYGLPYPPPGYAWVRVGEDAVLVDRFTGRIVQVVRFLFW